MNHRLTNDMASLRIMVSRKKGDGNMDSKVFGQFIAAMRKENNMTQAELGAALGWGDKGANRLAQYETNYRVPLSLIHI